MSSVEWGAGGRHFGAWRWRSSFERKRARRLEERKVFRPAVVRV